MKKKLTLVKKETEDVPVKQIISGQLDKKDMKHVPIGDLTPYKNNANKGDVDKVAASLKEFGYVKNSVGIDENNVLLYGHTTLKAMEKLGWTKVPEVTQVFGLSELQKKAYRIMDNASGRSAEWDLDLLVQELKELKINNFDISLAGFDDKEFAGFEREVNKGKEPLDSEPQISRAEELRKIWKTELGQMWQCGDHFVVCGDCTDPAVVARVMQGEKADMVFTDPPYNVAGEGRNYAADCSKAMNDLKNSAWDKDFNPDRALEIIEKNLAKDCAVYVCTSQFLVQKIWDWMAKWSDFNSYCVWCKPNPMPSLAKRHWTWATELIPYAVRGKHICNFPDGNHALNWWDITKEKDTNHPTEKPITVPSRAISFSSNNGAIVLDPFLGSGTTMIACENLGRKCRGVEVDPGYVAVCLERYKTTFNKMPVLLEGD